jgi:hypothetical protein
MKMSTWVRVKVRKPLPTGKQEFRDEVKVMAFRLIT